MKTKLKQYWDHWEVEVEFENGLIQVTTFSGGLAADHARLEQMAREFAANPRPLFT